MTTGGKETSIGRSHAFSTWEAVKLIATSIVTPACEFDLRSVENEEARSLQQALLPAGPMEGPIYGISYRNHSAADVGGDFLDYFYLSDGSLGLYLADVVGKGLTAAMYATLAMGTLRAIHKTGQQPAHVLEVFNRRLRVRPVPHRFCATLYAVFDPVTLKFRFSNAGLPYPIHISQGKGQPLEIGGIPSGMFDGVRYEQHTLQLAPGDAVLFATDGLHEAADAERKEFGFARLTDLCAERAVDSTEQLLDRVLDAASEHSGGRQHDDVTAVVLRVAPATNGRP
jgi:sigma-B regulation protein RsbU (phosphoserine phosphatase)